jgi:hypothetical protein
MALRKRAEEAEVADPKSGTIEGEAKQAPIPME